MGQGSEPQIMGQGSEPQIMGQGSEPQIMGIWNVSPDSFSSCCEGGSATTIAHAQELVRQGADILDVGAESTRPGATPIDTHEEIRRLREPLAWAREHVGIPISLDSRHAETIEWALENGLVDIVNDVGESEGVSEDREGRIYEAVARARAGIVLMAWGDPRAPGMPWDECVKKIADQLRRRVQFALERGVGLRSIAVDPGIGFGKGMENDLRLIRSAPKDLAFLGCPVLIAHSRKRCLARATGLTVDQLDWPTAVASALAMQAGAAIVRVHRPDLTRIARKLVPPLP